MAQTSTEPPAEAVEGPLGLLGVRIRHARLARSMTLVQLAERAGLSHSFLSQVERGRANPSMTSLERVAVALGVGVVELLPAGPRAQQVATAVLRSHEGLRGPYGAGTARLLGPEMLAFVPIEFTGANAELGDAFAHDEDEFVLVVEGAIELELGGHRYSLGEGDSAVIAGGTEHRWCSPGGSPYRLFIVKEELGAIEPEEMAAAADQAASADEGAHVEVVGGEPMTGPVEDGAGRTT